MCIQANLLGKFGFHVDLNCNFLDFSIVFYFLKMGPKVFQITSVLIIREQVFQYDQKHCAPLPVDEGERLCELS